MFPQYLFVLRCLVAHEWGRALRAVLDLWVYRCNERGVQDIMGDFAAWSLPRLCRFRADRAALMAVPVGLQPDEWRAALNSMIEAVALLQRQANGDLLTPDQQADLRRGLRAFADLLPYLWT